MASPISEFSISTTDSNTLNSKYSNLSDTADLNMRIVQSLLWFVEDKFGIEKLKEISLRTAIELPKLQACKNWISLEQTETILSLVRELTENDEAFMDACTYRLRESYGTLRYLLWATTPGRILESAQKHFSSISTFSHGDATKLEDGKYRLRYFSNQPESRLMCLSRQAQSATLPLLWDLPKAKLTETACICNGDSHCEYELSVYEKGRLLPVLTGGLIGLLASLAIINLDIQSALASTYLWGITPFLGAALGYIRELRRANRKNLTLADDINSGLSQIVIENHETQQEILNLHQRQKHWNIRLEEQVSERARSSEKLTKELQSILEEQTSALKGVSHDMKNPLTVILQTAEIMRGDIDEKNMWMLEEQKLAVHRIRDLLDDMLQLEHKEASGVQFMPERVKVKTLEETLNRRLRALTGEKDLITEVGSKESVPETILIDRMILDRVMDNLLTNALKYTVKGKITLLLDGKPGFLTVMLSDTGRGIAETDVLRIFSAGGSDPETREKHSHGLGLSVVVRLLDRIGGHLEVMSALGKGTTFWTHFPVEPGNSINSKSLLTDVTERVVTIRKMV